MSRRTISFNEAAGNADLRRSTTRPLIDSIRDRSRHLPPPEQALICEVFEHGRPIAVVAESRGEDPRKLARRVRRITGRLLDPRFVFVAEHRARWRPTQREVASLCVIEGLSIRQAATKLNLSPHTVRKHKEAIDALCELLPERGRQP